MKHLFRIVCGLATLVCAVLANGLMSNVSAAPSSTGANAVQVIATGLNNPRGVALGADGTVYVSEAGLGAGNAKTGPQNGFGYTSSITRIRWANSSHPSQQRIVTGLPSVAQTLPGSTFPEAIGADGISVIGSGNDARIYTVIGENPSIAHHLGNLLRVSPRGWRTAIANVGSYDYEWSGDYKTAAFAPKGQFPDADPYGVLTSWGHTYVADAASNTLDEVLPNGRIEVIAYFPNTPLSDAVPTCVARGPDGALYIGTLALADFFTNGPGQSVVYRVDPRGVASDSLNTVLHIAKVWATGFSTITGCTFDSHGHFYAAEMFTNDVVRASFAHPAWGRTVLGKGNLTLPNGIAVDNGGNVYVSNMSDNSKAGQGSVVRIRTNIDN